MFLDVEDLLAIAKALGTLQVRDMGLLVVAAARPQASVFGEDAYPGIHEKAAALLHSLARNHALVDGNKRIAWVATRLFCRLNGCDLQMPENVAYELVLAVARGELEVAAIAATLEPHVRGTAHPGT